MGRGRQCFLGHPKIEPASVILSFSCASENYIARLYLERMAMSSSRGLVSGICLDLDFMRSRALARAQDLSGGGDAAGPAAVRGRKIGAGAGLAGEENTIVDRRRKHGTAF